MKKKITWLFALAAPLILGFHFITDSWEGAIYSLKERSGEFRSPASINLFDVSTLQKTSLKMISKKRLIEKAFIEKSSKGVGLRLGHFTVRGPGGELERVCDLYEKVKIVFHSDDMRVHGKPCSMTIEAQCYFDHETQSIGPIWLPLEELVRQNPVDLTLPWEGEEGFSGAPETLLKMRNISDSWPQEWSLVSIRLFNLEMSTGATQELRFDQERLRSLSKKTLSFAWEH